MNKATLKDIRGWQPGPEYTDTGPKIKGLMVGRDTVGVGDVLMSGIEHDDKMWFVLRQYFFTPRELARITAKIADSMMNYLCQKYPEGDRPTYEMKVSETWSEGEILVNAADGVYSAYVSFVVNQIDIEDRKREQQKQLEIVRIYAEAKP